ncbi:hypothetical protein Mzhil_0045 [Methanosalsum zhilinae DSM 4017]|uniref:Transmembrane protein n=1 Tax=Methanosalsum zhilinae (strain DSM 4017 / NBRC 107636 / OCM 62 / WeN5) TaxID=679901 RepID=F7XMK0_METZD|nr:hypothetical protein [Methanosalsum zhilinae]AEH59926.1 hypothetical protein Mzhil_0045 [Methanosalsum zhilinae DSM 4017]
MDPCDTTPGGKGYLESVAQNVRSIEKRLRAVERRLSMKDHSSSSGEYNDICLETCGQCTNIVSVDEVKHEIDALRNEIVSVRDQIPDTEQSDEFQEFWSDGAREHIDSLEKRVSQIEDGNKVKIGSFKIPFELSGLIAAIFLFITGVLIYSQRWDVIRSPYFSLTLSFALVMSVLMKIYLVRRS